ncbi:hypothetical protein AGI3411_02519 [Achromobacter agilis]|uniref:Uncharacterized protein n=2 Tax=Achromobacter agilis TaxID=1353888 RepID=A0A446CEV7_9BURK|nr:hypothetical protein AGI3411_02519 [Achromobacter agilis]
MWYLSCGLAEFVDPAPSHDSLTKQASCASRQCRTIIHLAEIQVILSALWKTRRTAPASKPGSHASPSRARPACAASLDWRWRPPIFPRSAPALSESLNRPSYPHFYPQAQASNMEAERRNSVHNRDGDIFVNNRPRLAQNRSDTDWEDKAALPWAYRRFQPKSCQTHVFAREISCFPFGMTEAALVQRRTMARGNRFKKIGITVQNPGQDNPLASLLSTKSLMPKNNYPQTYPRVEDMLVNTNNPRMRRENQGRK